MSTFSDELRKVIANKADQLKVAEFYRQRQASERERKRDELHTAATGVVRDVFRPLVADFAAALQDAGLFAKSTLFIGRTRKGAHTCSCRAETRRGREYRVRFFAAASEEGRIELSADCALRRGVVRERPTDAPAWAQVFETPEPAERSPENGASDWLVKIPAKSISFETAKMQNPSVGEWCREALKKCAAAVMEANRKKDVNVE